MANRYINAAVALSTTSATDVYVVPTGCSALVQSLTLANEGVSTSTITVTFYDSSAVATFTLIKDASIPAAASGNLLDRPFPLEAGDKITVQAASANVFDATASILLVDDTTSVPVGAVTTAALADGSVTSAKLDIGDLAYHTKLYNEVFG